MSLIPYEDWKDRVEHYEIAWEGTVPPGLWDGCQQGEVVICEHPGPGRFRGYVLCDDVVRKIYWVSDSEENAFISALEEAWNASVEQGEAIFKGTVSDPAPDPKDVPLLDGDPKEFMYPVRVVIKRGKGVPLVPEDITRSLYKPRSLSLQMGG